MASAIDATKPVDGVPADKADLRNNLAAAKDEIEDLQIAAVAELAADTLTVDAAYIGGAASALVRCTSANDVTITLAADVPAGKGVHLVQYSTTGEVFAEAGVGATLNKRAAASTSTAEQYDSLVIVVANNPGGTAAEWLIVG